MVRSWEQEAVEDGVGVMGKTVKEDEHDVNDLKAEGLQ
jgi:hypothetical protein